MDQKTQSILEQIPPGPPRSKLEPHREFIQHLRQRRKTYREIAAILAEHFHLSVHYSTIYVFIHTHREEGGELPDAPNLVPPTGPRPPSDPCETATIGHASPSPSGAEADIYAHIEELKRRKRTPVASPEPKFNFHYEEGEPLRLISDRSKHK
jgi:transposase